MTASFVNTDDYVDSMANRMQRFSFDKSMGPTLTAGQVNSYWLATGTPGPGVAPTTPAVPTMATAGSLARFANPTSGESMHVHSYMVVQNGTSATLYLYDRLSHMGGLSGTSTSAQTVNTSAITRGDTNGKNVRAWVDVYTTLGATPRTLTVTYTNSAGVGSRTGTADIIAVLAASRAVLISLQTGDTGVKSVESVQLSGSTGAVGNFGITLRRRVQTLPIASAAIPVQRSGLRIGSPIVESSACLELIGIITNTGGGAGDIRGALSLIASG